MINGTDSQFQSFGSAIALNPFQMPVKLANPMNVSDDSLESVLIEAEEEGELGSIRDSDQQLLHKPVFHTQESYKP
jgi:hypothetical protein